MVRQAKLFLSAAQFRALRYKFTADQSHQDLIEALFGFRAPLQHPAPAPLQHAHPAAAAALARVIQTDDLETIRKKRLEKFDQKPPNPYPTKVIVIDDSD